ncbi:MAG: indole-3-glycerol phosphate synthase TrpC [Candidatus Zipacnadales bacterium]
MILDEIVANKRLELNETKRLLSLDEVKARLPDVPPPRNFHDALDGPKVAVIAEIKRASPSLGQIADELFDPRIIAQSYSGNGAAAISVVTERKYFQGESFHIKRARKYMPLPILRKDFLFDPYQVYESRMMMADAILLIVRILTDDQLVELLDLTYELGMAALVETHDEQEIERAANAGAKIIGINNRDLSTMTVDLSTTERLAKHVPSNVLIVSESGIETREDVERLACCGVHAVLVGTVLMRVDADRLPAVMRPLTGVYRPGFAPAT